MWENKENTPRINESLQFLHSLILIIMYEKTIHGKLLPVFRLSISAFEFYFVISLYTFMLRTTYCDNTIVLSLRA